MLKVNHIDAYYGKVQVLHNVSLEVGENEIISLIGANGAGKSTLMKTIMGLIRPKQGTIEFQKEDLTKIRNTKIVSKGVVYVPEGREVFPEMSVRDNLEMGAYCRKFSLKEMNEHLEEMYTIFPRLGERQKQLAGSLSGGEQQMLAIGRALMARPKMILLDEPSLGLSPLITKEVFAAIREINREDGITIFFVEQNSKIALKTAHRGYVMQTGEMVIEDTCENLMSNADVQKAYLGGE